MDRDMEKKMRLPQFWFSVTYRVLRIILSRLCIGRFEKKEKKKRDQGETKCNESSQSNGRRPTFV